MLVASDVLDLLKPRPLHIPDLAFEIFETVSHVAKSIWQRAICMVYACYPRPKPAFHNRNCVHVWVNLTRQSSTEGTNWNQLTDSESSGKLIDSVPKTIMHFMARGPESGVPGPVFIPYSTSSLHPFIPSSLHAASIRKSERPTRWTEFKNLFMLSALLQLDMHASDMCYLERWGFQKQISLLHSSTMFYIFVTLPLCSRILFQ